MYKLSRSRVAHVHAVSFDTPLPTDNEWIKKGGLCTFPHRAAVA